MSSSTATNVPTVQNPVRYPAIPGWVWGGVIGALCLCLFRAVITRTFLIIAESNNVADGLGNVLRGKFQPDWSHGLLLPLISLYYLSQHRTTLARLWRGRAKDAADLGPALRVVAAIIGGPAGLLAYLLWHRGGAGHAVFLAASVVAVAAAAAFLVGPLLLRRRGSPVAYGRACALLRLAGVGLFFGGTFSFGWWLGPGRNDMLQGYSVIVALFGLTMFCLGPATMKVLWFPIFYLALAFKVSDRYWDQLADYLRLMVAQAATVVLEVLRVDVDLSGARMTIHPAHGAPVPLEIADACSGLRSLMAYIALGLAVAWLSQRTAWQRWVMAAMTIPVAIVINIGRVTTLGLLSLRWPALTQGQAHIFIGMLMLIPALLLLLAIGWVLDHMVIREGAAAGPLPLPPAAGPDPVILPRWFLGAASGLALAGLLGGCYLLAMTIMRPQDMFQGRLSQGLAVGLLLAAAAALIPAIWFTWRALRRDNAQGLAGRSGTLGVATGILLACVLGSDRVLAANGLVIFKLAVPLRHEFVEIPATVGHWKRIADIPFGEEEREMLGPSAVNWVYARTEHPDAGAAVFHLTYYTGMVDTVPHVPERCELAGGAKELRRQTVTLHLAGPGYHHVTGPAGDKVYVPSGLSGGNVLVPDTDIPATVCAFADSNNQTYCVLYFFVANGEYFANPDAVRANGFKPTDRYNYYSKVQIRLLTGDVETARVQASELLSIMMPEVLACLPDWDQVSAGLWPRK